MVGGDSCFVRGKMGGMKHIVMVGDMKIGAGGDMIVTHALGSCLGLAAFDPAAKVGGLLHAMLPLSSINPEKAQANPAIFVDINMPVMNGEEMIAQMRGRSETKETPAIVVPTEGSQTRIERLQRLGVRFIHKPFTPEAIRDTIKEMLGSEVFHDRSR